MLDIAKDFTPDPARITCPLLSLVASRFASAPDVAGTWDPWFFFAAGIWLIILVIHALRAYLGPPVGPLGRYIRRPIQRADLDREVERLKGRR